VLTRIDHESLESSRVESDSKSTAYKLQSVWFQHALYDRCLFHVTLYIGSSYLDIRTGETPSTLTLYHQNEVIRSVNERLSDPGEALEDCTIAAVALLALFSVRIPYLRGLSRLAEQIVESRQRSSCIAGPYRWPTTVN
jgi:hypothetical protein